MTTNQAIKILKRTFPDINGIRPGSDLGYDGDCIHLGDVAEGGTIDGLSACVYNSGFDDPREEIWVMGIHRKLGEALSELGFYAEWRNGGAVTAYRL